MLLRRPRLTVIPLETVSRKAGPKRGARSTMTSPETTGFDFETLRRAIERGDPDLALSLYVEEARVTIVDACDPFNPPFELRGKAEIARYLRAVLLQKTIHQIEGEIFAEGRVKYHEACEYPDGTRVLVATTLDVEEGKILRQVERVSRDGEAP